MKKLFISDAVHLGGGAEFSFYQIIREAKNDDVLVIAPEGEYLEKLRGLNMPLKTVKQGIFRRANPLPFLQTIFRLKKEIDAFGPDWVIANGFNACEYSYFAAKLSGKKFCYYVRDFPEILNTRLRRYCFKNADKLIANSQAVKKEFSAFFSINPDRIEVSYPPIDLEKFKPLPKTDARVKKIKQELGLGGKFVVGCFGRLSREKGQDYLIEAVKRLNDKKVKLLIVGDSKIGMKDFEKELREKAKPLGPNCLFTGFRTDLVELINACDVVVCPSKKEPFGRIIVESLACGRPVIATKTCGAKEVVNEKKFSVIEPENCLALAKLLEKYR